MIQFYFVRYFCLSLLILGTLGNTLNLCIFTRRKLRSIPCSLYFLASTCSCFIALYVGCLSRVLATFNINPQAGYQAAIYCKIRSYFTYGSLSLSIWLMVGAGVDRWASSCTSVRIRSISRMKIAKRVILSIVIIIYLIYVQMFFCFDGLYQSNSSDCVTVSSLCELYNDSALFLTQSLLPCLLMLIFGLLTIRNVRHSRRNILPLNSPFNNPNKKKTPTQMTVMVLVQVTCSIILSLPLSIQNIYNELTEDFPKSQSQEETEDFLGILFALITLVNSSISFYIFTITGKIFREELKHLFSFIVRTPVLPNPRQNMVVGDQCNNRPN